MIKGTDLLVFSSILFDLNRTLTLSRKLLFLLHNTTNLWLLFDLLCANFSLPGIAELSFALTMHDYEES